MQDENGEERLRASAADVDRDPPASDVVTPSSHEGDSVAVGQVNVDVITVGRVRGDLVGY
jgi:hypothetical protein